MCPLLRRCKMFSTRCGLRRGNGVLFCSLLRQISNPPAKSQPRPVHTLPDSPSYELRIYSIWPQYFKEFLGLLEKHWSVRTAHSKATGFWATEIGGVAEVVHIWEYGSLSNRADARKMLADNEIWQKEFLLNFFPMAKDMNNTVMALAPGSTLCTHFESSPSAVYELHTREAKNIPPVYVNAGEKLVGRFTGIYGPTGTEYHLYRYPNQDAAYAGALQRRREDNVKGYSRLMLPCAWSPLK